MRGQHHLSMSRPKLNVNDVTGPAPGSSWFARLVSSLHPPPPRPEGPEGVKTLGHRAYVGGLWDEIGSLQFEFLVNRGLKPHHYLLDVACGSLRAGVHFISYLDRGHYLGIEKEQSLLQAGLENELGPTMFAEKQPQLVISKDFEFGKLGNRPNFALAHSLFTHLPAHVINDCLTKLRGFIQDDGAFYATFNEVPREIVNPETPHDHANFQYTRQQLERLAASSGWTAEYIGDWNHPRNSKMMRFLPS
jgi:hypothetical protein